MGIATDLDGSAEVRFGPAQPQHACDGHADTQPREEAEEVDDGEDVLRQRVEHGQAALEKKEIDTQREMKAERQTDR